MAWTRFSQAAGGRARPVALLGLAQTLSWGSSFYLPAVLAHPMATDLGLPPPMVYLAFSLALVVSAAVGPAAGRAIDRVGGRPVLLGCNGIFALGLVLLALAQGPWGLFAAWAVLGVAMGAGLYEAAFATLVRLYGQAARNPITGITLIAGFASTVGWPLTQWGLDSLGWRGTCLGWAALHIVLGLPLHSLLPRGRVEEAPPVRAATTPGTPSTAPAPSHATAGHGVAVVLAAVFAIAWFTSTAMAAHLPLLLQAQGLSASTALGVAMLVGPAQVAGRLLEFGFLRRAHPLLSSRFATAGHPLGVLLLALGGPLGGWLFAVMHGMGNGILTIAKGTLPLVVFGAAGYGERQGWLMAPARVAQAFAPVLFGLAMAHWGGRALWLTAGLGLLALALLQGLALHMGRSAVVAPTAPRPDAPA